MNIDLVNARIAIDALMKQAEYCILVEKFEEAIIFYMYCVYLETNFPEVKEIKFI